MEKLQTAFSVTDENADALSDEGLKSKLKLGRPFVIIDVAALRFHTVTLAPTRAPFDREEDDDAEDDRGADCDEGTDDAQTDDDGGDDRTDDGVPAAGDDIGTDDAQTDDHGDNDRTDEDEGVYDTMFTGDDPFISDNDDVLDDALFGHDYNSMLDDGFLTGNDELFAAGDDF